MALGVVLVAPLVGRVLDRLHVRDVALALLLGRELALELARLRLAHGHHVLHLEGHLVGWVRRRLLDEVPLVVVMVLLQGRGIERLRQLLMLLSLTLSLLLLRLFDFLLFFSLVIFSHIRLSILSKINNADF